MTREHWTQAAYLALAGIIALGSTTTYIVTRIDTVQMDTLRANDAVSQRLASDEEAIAAIKSDMAEHYADEHAALAEVRAALGTMVNQLADLKVILARKEDLRVR
jgi:hypothetical protein